MQIPAILFCLSIPNNGWFVKQIPAILFCLAKANFLLLLPFPFYELLGQLDKKITVSQLLFLPNFRVNDGTVADKKLS